MFTKTNTKNSIDKKKVPTGKHANLQYKESIHMGKSKKPLTV